MECCASQLLCMPRCWWSSSRRQAQGLDKLKTAVQSAAGQGEPPDPGPGPARPILMDTQASLYAVHPLTPPRSRHPQSHTPSIHPPLHPQPGSPSSAHPTTPHPPHAHAHTHHPPAHPPAAHPPTHRPAHLDGHAGLGRQPTGQHRLAKGCGVVALGLPRPAVPGWYPPRGTCLREACLPFTQPLGCKKLDSNEGE